MITADEPDANNGNTSHEYDLNWTLKNGEIGMRDRVNAYDLFERLQGDIAREVRVLLGEEQYDQRIFTDAEHARRREALLKCAHEQTDDATRHEAWIKMHVEQGWVYGPEFKPAEKQHPNLLPWDQLPASTRSKARIFDLCARYALELDTFLNTPAQESAS